MVTQYWRERVERRRALVDQLIHEKGIARYGLFGVTTEGKRLPDGSESSSGFVVDSSGSVHAFWLDWDSRRERAVFVRWYDVRPDEDWGSDEEYLEARQAAGLP